MEMGLLLLATLLGSSLPTGVFIDKPQSQWAPHHTNATFTCVVNESFLSREVEDPLEWDINGVRSSHQAFTSFLNGIFVRAAWYLELRMVLGGTVNGTCFNVVRMIIRESEVCRVLGQVPWSEQCLFCVFYCCFTHIAIDAVFADAQVASVTTSHNITTSPQYHKIHHHITTLLKHNTNTSHRYNISEPKGYNITV